MKNIVKSLAIVAGVATIVVGGSIAYFSDTETSSGNTFTTGTIDISVDGHNPWSETTPYVLDDMKPGYVDYTNFVIENVGTNPVNVTKSVSGISDDENGINESECVAYDGTWTGGDKQDGVLGIDCVGYDSNKVKNDLENVIAYDLSVVVKDGSGNPIWNQTLYNNDKTIAEIEANGGMFLGMIPVGDTMEVTESYHMNKDAGNEYQSDKMTFDITLVGEQLKGEVVLEDKDTSNWRVKSETTEKANLTYDVTGNEFKYTLIGISPIHNQDVALVTGYNGNTNPDTLIGYGSTDGSGNITMNNSSVDLGKDLVSAKVWLTPKSAWTEDGGVSGHISNWGAMSNFLWETGLIDYYDTNI